MPIFRDNLKREWSLDFDGLLLAKVRDECGINLANVAGADYVRIKSDNADMTRAMCVLLSDQLRERNVTEREFARTLNGVWDEAWAAIWSAAKLFFSLSQWSDLERNLTKHLEMTTEITASAPLMAVLNQIPPAMQAGFVQGMMEQFKTGSGGSPTSTGNGSASGPAKTPLTSPSDGQPNAEFTPLA